jgi:hypothetical protein
MPVFTSLVPAGFFTLLSSGDTPLPIAMWLAPLFLLRFAHLSPTPAGFALMFVVLYAVAAAANRAGTPPDENRHRCRSGSRTAPTVGLSGVFWPVLMTGVHPDR